MPEFKATVVGENFNFMVDEEPQYLKFSRTLYVDAADETAVQALVLDIVRQELLAQALLNEASEQRIMMDSICPVDLSLGKQEKGEFLWYFPDEDDFDDEG